MKMYRHLPHRVAKIYVPEKLGLYGSQTVLKAEKKDKNSSIVC